MTPTFTYVLILLACAAGPVLILAGLLAQARRDVEQMRLMRDEAHTAYRNIRNLYTDTV